MTCIQLFSSLSLHIANDTVVDYGRKCIHLFSREQMGCMDTKGICDLVVKVRGTALTVLPR